MWCTPFILHWMETLVQPWHTLNSNWYSTDQNKTFYFWKSPDFNIYDLSLANQFNLAYPMTYHFQIAWTLCFYWISSGRISIWDKHLKTRTSRTHGYFTTNSFLPEWPFYKSFEPSVLHKQSLILSVSLLRSHLDSLWQEVHCTHDAAERFPYKAGWWAGRFPHSDQSQRASERE